MLHVILAAVINHASEVCRSSQSPLKHWCHDIQPMTSFFYEADDQDCREVEQWWQARIRFLIGNGQAYDAAALFEDFELERKLTFVKPVSDETTQ